MHYDNKHISDKLVI